MAKGRIYDRGVNKDRTQGLYAWTKRDVFLGYFATKEEAEQAVREWREKRKNSR